MKKLIYAAIAVWTFCVILFSPMEAKADTEDMVSNFQKEYVWLINMESIQNNKIVVTWNYRSNLSYRDCYGNPLIEITGFQIIVSTDKNFAQDKCTVYEMDSYDESKADFRYKLPISILGNNGKTFYVRICPVGELTDMAGTTTNGLKAGDKIYGNAEAGTGICWDGRIMSEDNNSIPMERAGYTFVKINKTNFPGMYTLLKNGYSYCDKNGTKTYYDINRDGWLDPSEISQISSITNYKYKKYNNEYWMCYELNTYQTKISTLKGLHYLPWVRSILIRDYTASKIDLTDYPHIYSLDVRKVLNKKLTVIAPKVRELSIQSELGGSWKDVALKTVDVSKCTGVYRLDIGGSYYQKVTCKLPSKAKNLRMFAYSSFTGSTLNLNAYTNLQDMELYNNDVSNLKLTSCKKLRYAYFYYMSKLKKVDLSKAANLTGVDAYGCKNLSTANIKTPNSTKVTREKGKWWYSTKKYKDMWNEIMKFIYS